MKYLKADPFHLHFGLWFLRPSIPLWGHTSPYPTSPDGLPEKAANKGGKRLPPLKAALYGLPFSAFKGWGKVLGKGGLCWPAVGQKLTFRPPFDHLSPLTSFTTATQELTFQTLQEPFPWTGVYSTRLANSVAHCSYHFLHTASTT